jgi:hypothetical protein
MELNQDARDCIVHDHFMGHLGGHFTSWATLGLRRTMIPVGGVHGRDRRAGHPAGNGRAGGEEIGGGGSAGKRREICDAVRRDYLDSVVFGYWLLDMGWERRRRAGTPRFRFLDSDGARLHLFPAAVRAGNNETITTHEDGWRFPNRNHYQLNCTLGQLRKITVLLFLNRLRNSLWLSRILDH